MTLKSKASKEELIERLKALLAKIKELDALVMTQHREINDLQIKVRDRDRIIEDQLKIIKSMPIASQTESTTYKIITLPSKVRT